MSRLDHKDYDRRGCAIGAEVTVTGNPLLIGTEADALLQHWRAMSMITLKAEPVDLDKLEFCVKRMRFWQDHITVETR